MNLHRFKASYVEMIGKFLKKLLERQICEIKSKQIHLYSWPSRNHLAKCFTYLVKILQDLMRSCNKGPFLAILAGIARKRSVLQYHTTSARYVRVL